MIHLGERQSLHANARNHHVELNGHAQVLGQLLSSANRHPVELHDPSSHTKAPTHDPQLITDKDMVTTINLDQSQPPFAIASHHPVELSRHGQVVGHSLRNARYNGPGQVYGQPLLTTEDRHPVEFHRHGQIQGQHPPANSIYPLMQLNGHGQFQGQHLLTNANRHDIQQNGRGQVYNQPSFTNTDHHSVQYGHGQILGQQSTHVAGYENIGHHPMSHNIHDHFLQSSQNNQYQQPPGGSGYNSGGHVPEYPRDFHMNRGVYNECAPTRMILNNHRGIDQPHHTIQNFPPMRQHNNDTGTFPQVTSFTDKNRGSHNNQADNPDNCLDQTHRTIQDCPPVPQRSKGTEYTDDKS